jgi:hypothetical protein
MGELQYATTGQLLGTPVAADVGPDDGISIKVSDGTSTDCTI